MKNLVCVTLSMFFIPIFVNGQAWKYKEGNDPFDGNYKTSYVIGKGFDFPYTEPLFVINLFSANSSQPNIALTSAPSPGCDNNTVLIKFDDDPKIFTPKVTASSDNEYWFLHFSNLPPLGKPNFNLLTDDEIKGIDGLSYIVPEFSLDPIIRDSEREDSEITHVSKTGDTLRLLNYDEGTAFWLVIYRNKETNKFELGFVKPSYIKVKYSDNVRFRLKSNVSFIESMNWAEKQASGAKETELEEFIRYIKTHSKMYVRISSDCVRSDFEFSLSGSSTAMNFLFKK